MTSQNVDINSGDIICSQLKNKSWVHDAAGENNLLATPATNYTHDYEAATSSNLCSQPRDTSELITLSDASHNLTRIQCYFYHLWNHLIDYVSNPVQDGVVIYTGNVPFQYNEQEGIYTEFSGNQQIMFF